MGVACTHHCKGNRQCGPLCQGTHCKAPYTDSRNHPVPQDPHGPHLHEARCRDRLLHAVMRVRVRSLGAVPRSTVSTSTEVGPGVSYIRLRQYVWRNRMQCEP
jgi:hypothetical protein